VLPFSFCCRAAWSVVHVCMLLFQSSRRSAIHSQTGLPHSRSTVSREVCCMNICSRKVMQFVFELLDLGSQDFHGGWWMVDGRCFARYQSVNGSDGMAGFNSLGQNCENQARAQGYGLCGRVGYQIGGRWTGASSQSSTCRLLSLGRGTLLCCMYDQLAFFLGFLGAGRWVVMSLRVTASQVEIISLLTNRTKALFQHTHRRVVYQ